MTPEQAEDIYYAAYRQEGMIQHHENRPLNQSEIRAAAWQAVIDAVTKEIDTDWTKRYLAMQDYHEAAKK